MGGQGEALIILLFIAVLAILAGNLSFSVNLYDVNFLNLEYFFSRLYQFFSGDLSEGVGLSTANDLLVRLLAWVIILSTIFFIGIIYFVMRIRYLRQEDEYKYGHILPSDLEDKPLRNTRWENLKAYLESESESDWKLAIIEADKLLEELVEKLGYLGDNLGERLKAVEPSDFTTLQDAWEAHKIRNKIAHEQNYRLTHRDARLTIARFERVFQEFSFI